MQIMSNPLFLEFILPVLAISAVLWICFLTLPTERKNLLRVWKGLQPFKRNCLKAGSLAFVFINLPFPAKEAYTSQILSNITTVLGSAMFAFGALEFLKSLHDMVNRSDDSGWR